MTEDLIEMARESGAAFDPTFESALRNPMWLFSPMDLARFAALIEARAVARTREECAKVCEDQDTGQGLNHDQAAFDCAAAIRALGERT